VVADPDPDLLQGVAGGDDKGDARGLFWLLCLPGHSQALGRLLARGLLNDFRQVDLQLGVVDLLSH
jgi:hypothetical protein